MPIKLGQLRKMKQMIDLYSSGDGSSSSNVTVPSFSDLEALPLTERIEGVVYIVLDEDIQYLYDSLSDSFKSTVKEMDGGIF